MAREPEISVQTVRKVARLARLAMDDAAAEQYRSELAAVLGYMQSLQSLDLTGVEPMHHPGPTEGAPANRLAADEPGPMLPTQVLIDLAPQSAPPFVTVPRVIGGESS